MRLLHVVSGFFRLKLVDSGKYEFEIRENNSMDIHLKSMWRFVAFEFVGHIDIFQVRHRITTQTTAVITTATCQCPSLTSNSIARILSCRRKVNMATCRSDRWYTPVSWSVRLLSLRVGARDYQPSCSCGISTSTVKLAQNCDLKCLRISHWCRLQTNELSCVRKSLTTATDQLHSRQ